MLLKYLLFDEKSVCLIGIHEEPPFLTLYLFIIILRFNDICHYNIIIFYESKLLNFHLSI